MLKNGNHLNQVLIHPSLKFQAVFFGLLFFCCQKKSDNYSPALENVDQEIHCIEELFSHNQSMQKDTDELREMQRQAYDDKIQVLLVGAGIIRDHKLLLIRRAPGEKVYPGYVEIPGGAVIVGETLELALTRETLEETGLTMLKMVDYIHSFDFKTESKRKAREFAFIIQVDEGEVRLNPEEHDEFYWVNITEEFPNNFLMTPEMRHSVETIVARGLQIL